MTLKVLLVAYKFPPYAGVGAYRWSKLAKYFAESGVEVHVVTVFWDAVSLNTLIEDTEHHNIIIHRIGNSYPYNFALKNYNSKLKNILKNLYMQILNRFVYWDDEAQYWGRRLIPFCERLIRRESINTIIATGHPFRSLVHALKIKINNPKIKFIADYRDTWFQDQKNNLSQSRFLRLRTTMESIMKGADLNVFVTKGLISEYLNFVDPKIRENIKVSLIRNGVDLAKVSFVKCHESFEYDFIHAGNISNGREEPLRQFLHCLQRIRPISSVLLIGVVPRSIIEEFKSMKNLVVSDPIAQSDVFKMIANSRYALHLNARHSPHALSTKIYEYPALGRPTVSINYGGEIDDLINEYSLGYSLNPDNGSFETELSRVVHAIPSVISLPSLFSYESIAMQYLKKIRELHR